MVKSPPEIIRLAKRRTDEIFAYLELGNSDNVYKEFGCKTFGLIHEYECKGCSFLGVQHISCSCKEPDTEDALRTHEENRHYCKIENYVNAKKSLVEAKEEFLNASRRSIRKKLSQHNQ
jgi:hypothetical protein